MVNSTLAIIVVVIFIGAIVVLGFLGFSQIAEEPIRQNCKEIAALHSQLTNKWQQANSAYQDVERDRIGILLDRTGELYDKNC